MSCLQKLFNCTRDARHLCARLSSLRVGPARAVAQPATCKMLAAQIHSTPPRYDLMEFFDDPKNWSANEVRSGRAWRTDELRIKSNSDLHKLWFVLLKEQNMLLTMEHQCEIESEPFPSPERLDKVKESMQNLETVVRERNRAYHLLETGEDGERPGEMKENVFGLQAFYNASEHKTPREHNEPAVMRERYVRKFLKLYNEQLKTKQRKLMNRNRNHVTHLLRRFPDIDRDMLKTKYPEVDIEKIERDDKSRGHFAPKIEK